MSTMSNLKRKQTNYKIVKNQQRVKNIETKMTIKYLLNVRKHLENEFDQEIITYLIFCIKENLIPSREYIIDTLTMMQTAFPKKQERKLVEFGYDEASKF